MNLSQLYRSLDKTIKDETCRLRIYGRDDVMEGYILFWNQSLISGVQDFLKEHREGLTSENPALCYTKEQCREIAARTQIRIDIEDQTFFFPIDQIRALSFRSIVYRKRQA